MLEKKLGFGLMRLPLKGDDRFSLDGIEMNTLKAMVDTFINHKLLLSLRSKIT